METRTESFAHEKKFRRTAKQKDKKRWKTFIFYAFCARFAAKLSQEDEHVVALL